MGSLANAVVDEGGEVIGWATKWNPTAFPLAECIVQFKDGSADSAIFNELSFLDGHDNARDYLNSLEP